MAAGKNAGIGAAAGCRDAESGGADGHRQRYRRHRERDAGSGLAQRRHGSDANAAGEYDFERHGTVGHALKAQLHARFTEHFSLTRAEKLTFGSRVRAIPAAVFLSPEDEQRVRVVAETMVELAGHWPAVKDASLLGHSICVRRSCLWCGWGKSPGLRALLHGWMLLLPDR
jgi:hypothetical protein